MRVLVTGCAGFIGSHLSEALLEDGHEVLGVDCFNDNYGRRQKLRNLEQAMEWDLFEFVPIDLARGELTELVESCDAVVHLAAEPGVRPSWGKRFESYVRNNVMATQHLLEAAVAQPEKRFVYASSSSIYGQADRFPTHESATPAPFSPYGMTKLSGEHLCAIYSGNFGVDAVALRFFSVYGPRQRPDMAFRIFCTRLLAGEPLEVYGDGGQTRDFTYVGDIVAAIRSALVASGVRGQAFNIGGGSRVSLARCVDVLTEIAGERTKLIHSPSQRGDVRDTGADIAAAQAALKYEPLVELDEGLRRQWEWAEQDAARPLPGR